jgi:branched-chain amino acid aminotransferase
LKTGAKIGFVLHRHILHNDTIRDFSDHALAPGQVGLLAGWGVFSTLRVTSGVLFAWDRHWARLKRDAAAFHVPLPDNPEKVHSNLLELIEANHAQESTLRLVIVRNGGGMWADPNPARSSDLIALTADSKDWGDGVKLAYQADARHAASPFAGTKILSWSMNLTWLESAQQRGFDEVILLNERGEVAECTSANIFAACGNQVWTPPLSSGCLPGITREVVLCEIHAPGIEIMEKALTPADLEAAEEVFITSTTRDLLCVREIEGRKIRCTERTRVPLQEAFSAYLQRYVEEHRAAATR